MKKICSFLAIIALFSLNACADSFEDNVKQMVQKSTNEETQIVSSDKIKSFEDLQLVVLKDAEGNAFPLFVSDDGTSFLTVPQYFHFTDNADKELLAKRLGEVDDTNKKAQAFKFDAIFDAMPKDASVLLSAENKTDDLLTIVTDPDCPYCRAELEKLKDHLKTTNVRIVLAPVHDETAYIKSALIMKEAIELNPSETDKIIAVFEKYYKDVELDDEQKKISTSVIHDNAEKIFGSRLITGVPYLHYGKMK